MKRTYLNLFLTLLIILICISPLFSQSSNGDIRMEKNFWGVKFYQDQQLLRPKDVLEIMRTNDEAYQEFRKAKSNYDFAMVLGAVGGALIGWPIGTAIAGGEPEWGLAAGGAALVLVSIPLSTSFTKHATTAINLYNGPASSTRFQPKMHIGLHGAGVRVAIKF